MPLCGECGFLAKNLAGLAAHRRLKHPAETRGGTNRQAAEQTLAILKRQGWIEDVDAARVQTIRSLADALDKDDGNAQMWRTYREAIEDLMRADENADSSLDQALAQIRSAGPLGDTQET